MALDTKTMLMIRTAINDNAETYTHSNADITSIYTVLNENVYRTIAHFLLADAIALTDPTAPTSPTLTEAPALETAPTSPTLEDAPTLEDPPTFLSAHAIDKWRQQNRDLLEKWGQENSTLLSKYANDTAKWQQQNRDTLGKWERTDGNALTKYASDLTKYRSQVDLNQLKMQILRDQAGMYRDLGEGAF